MQRKNIECNKMQLQLFESVYLLHKRVQIKNLISKPHYNGRRGKVVLFHNTLKKYEVYLDPVESENGSGNSLFDNPQPLWMYVHADNLEEV